MRIWKTETYTGKRKTTHYVRWTVAGIQNKRPFRTAALADSFRADLTTAARKGEAFDVTSGLPVSQVKAQAASTSFFEFACTYADFKWPDASPKHRAGIAEALVTATMAMLDLEAPVSEARSIRSALMHWGFNTSRREACPPDAAARHLQWIREHSRPVADLADPDVSRQLHRALGLKVTGKAAAPRTGQLKRTLVSGALDHATEKQLLIANPFKGIQKTDVTTAGVVDRRVVVNPTQAAALFDAVSKTPRSGPQLEAFFGCIYYAATRPEEAAVLRMDDLDLPDPGSPEKFGWLILRGAAPESRASWSDDGQRRSARQLKHRPRGSERVVPCPPELVALLRKHIETFGTLSDGRLFGRPDGEFPASTYTRIWSRARKKAFTPAQVSSPLAARPYDLRHAAVSTWLNAGVEATQVAEWAGHSVAVLLRVYAKCIDGQQQAALDKIQTALSSARPPKNEDQVAHAEGAPK